MIKHRGRLMAGVIVLVLAGTAITVGLDRYDAGAGHESSKASTAEADPTELPAAEKAARRVQIDGLLASRARAVLKGDLKTFLAAVDPKQPALLARQRTLFVNLRKFGFASLQYTVADEWKASAVRDKYGPTTFSTRLMMRYQLVGLDSRPVKTDLGYSFVRRGKQWILVEDGAIDEVLSATGHRQPWDFQEVAIIRHGPLVIAVDNTETALGTKIARVSEEAVLAVRRHWPRPWSGAVLVVAMSEDRVMATVWRDGADEGLTISAKAISLYDVDPRGNPTAGPVGSRIVINPAVRKTLDEELLVHELTHVATTPLGHHAPNWLVEGVAEHVRFSTIEDNPEWTVDPYRTTVRTKYLPAMKVLPDSEEFYRHGAQSYARAWWAVEYLVSKVGVKGLASLYADLGAHNTGPAAYSAIMKRHTGMTPAEFTGSVKAFKG
jgi:hypothetical protein